MDHTVYISLGSNLGERSANLAAARDLLARRCGRVTAVSSVYRSAPYGYVSENEYYNQCICLRTVLEPLPLMEQMLSIESEIGRVRDSRGYEDRLIDLDMLLYDALVMQAEGLILPHPRMSGRRFVLLPLSEIASGVIHPVSLKTVEKLLSEAPPDSSLVRSGDK